MNIEIWIAYTLAATIILVIPGPTIILVVGQAITHGRTSVSPLVAGVVLGDLTAMVLSLAGLGTILAVSATLFTVLKWVGALYLFYLGFSLWRAIPKGPLVEEVDVCISAKILFKRSYVVTALNPKGIVFFTAFLPQFLNPRLETLPQLTLLGATFLILATLNAALYAVFASQMCDVLQSNRAQRWLNRCGGTALIGAGFLTAAMRRG